MSKSFLAPIVFVSLLLLGPGLANAGWKSTGPFGGSAQIVVVNPLDSKSLLAGTRSALLYRSADAGAAWEPVPFPHLYKVAIYAIAMDPKQNGVYLVGVASADGRKGADTDAGLYRTEDAGQTWNRIDLMKGKSVYALAAWDSQVIAAGTDEGVWRSDDAGKSWTRISPVANPEMQWIVSLAFDPTNNKVLYAGTPHLPWKTIDGGTNWHSVHTGIIDDSDVFSIHVDASHPDRVFASACSGIYCTRNAGDQWTKLHGIPGTDRRTHIITQDPQNPETVYAGTTEGLWKSADGGLTWVKKSTHSINSMSIDPADSKTLYLATESSGIIKSTNAGETYTPVNQGFVNRNITQFAFASAEGSAAPPRLFASTSYDGDFGGMFQSDKPGDSWVLVASHRKMRNENLITFAVAPSEPKLIWGASYDGLLKSADSGQTWERPKTYMEPEKKESKEPPKKTVTRRNAKGAVVKARPAVVPPRKAFPPEGVRITMLRFAPYDNSTLFAGTNSGVFVSANGGTDWKPLSLRTGRQPAVLDLFLAVERSASSSKAIAAATADGLFISTDGGSTWISSPVPNHPSIIYSVALSSSDSSQMIAATSEGMFQSRDSGASWEQCKKGLPTGWFNSVVYDIKSPQVVLAAQAGQLYRSADGGGSWKPFDNNGLEKVWVRELVPDSSSSGGLLALTRSRGVYVFDSAMSSSAAPVPAGSLARQ